MENNLVEKIYNDPKFTELVSKRSSFAWTLSIAMLVVYFAFILTIAFNPAVLGTPLSESGVTSIGIPVGIVIIFFAFILTGIYVKRANSEFDEMTQEIKKAHQE
jgi:uncharacterized membrane protein (DUF485 family)